MTRGPAKLTVGKITRGYRCRLELGHAGGRTSSRIKLQPGILDASKSPDWLARSLATTLAEQAPELVSGLRDALGTAPAGLEIAIEEPRLYRAPWELCLQQRQVLGDLTRYQAEELQLVRSVAGIAKVEPLPPPFTVLRAAAGNLGAIPDAFRYFRTTVAEDVSAAYLEDLAAGRPCEVLHLSEVTAAFSRGRGVLTLKDADGGLTAAGLISALGSAPPRLLILQGAADSFGALLDLGHRVAAKIETAVLITEPTSGQAAERLAQNLYMNIVHDVPLDRTAGQLRGRTGRVAFIGPRGSADRLRLSAAEGVIKGRRARILRHARSHLQRLQEQRAFAAERGAGDRFLAHLERSERRLEAAESRLGSVPVDFDYTRETGGSEPLKEANKSADAAEQEVERSRATTARVVNTCFVDGAEPVSPGDDLVAGRAYDLEVQIGLPSQRSNNRSETPLPEDELHRFASPDGIALRAVLFSADFEIEVDEREIVLPPRPAESEARTFPVRAPRNPGTAELQLCLYFRHNLIQALRISAEVVTGRPRRRKGNRADVVYVLDGRLEDPDSLAERELNLFADRSLGKTHTLSFLGGGWKAHAHLDNDKLETALANVRGRLLKCAEALYAAGGGAADKRTNRVPVEVLEQQLGRLALRGRELFHALASDRKIRDRLRRLVVSPRRLQVANSSSLRQIYPWAFIYDHPLVGSRHRLCPDFRTLLERRPQTAETLLSSTCFAAVCAHRSDRRVVCPSGFWGFRHTLEQPLSLDAEIERGLPRSISVSGPARCLMAVSEALQFHSEHAESLRGLPNFSLGGPISSVLRLLEELKDQAHHLIYFYCHGERPAEVGSTVLTLGSEAHKDYLAPGDLEDYDLLWEPLRPLVFINGCHTADATPKDLSSFQQSLRECGAAAVIGTEVDVSEYLARPTGERFFRLFLEPEATLGETIRQLRMDLLRRGNPLGLTYTPYGYADLHVEAAA